MFFAPLDKCWHMADVFLCQNSTEELRWDWKIHGHNVAAVQFDNEILWTVSRAHYLMCTCRLACKQSV